MGCPMPQFPLWVTEHYGMPRASVSPMGNRALWDGPMPQFPLWVREHYGMPRASVSPTGNASLRFRTVPQFPHRKWGHVTALLPPPFAVRPCASVSPLPQRGPEPLFVPQFPQVGAGFRWSRFPRSCDTFGTPLVLSFFPFLLAIKTGGRKLIGWQCCQSLGAPAPPGGIW